NDHIAKPINVAELFSTMARWIRPSAPALAVASQPVPIQLVASEAQKPEPELPALPALDGIDTAAGLKRMQGNHALYLKLLRKTAQDQADSLEQFDAAASAGDWTAAQRIIHSLKGVAGNIGAEALQQSCERLEAAAQAQRAEPQARTAVRQALGRVLEAIGSLPAEVPLAPATAPQGSTAALQQVEPERVAQVLAELARLIADSSFAAATRLEEERDLLGAAGLSAELEPLQAALEDYDFDAAESLIEQLIQKSTLPS
ncbi:Hpt domain-containing protein, partial [Thiohalocapsa marina]